MKGSLSTRQETMRISSRQETMRTDGIRHVGPDPNDAIRAAFYGLLLRAEGFAPDEAAALVVQRYPAARKRLERLLCKPTEREKPLTMAATP
jgi:hypothetical protein